MMMITVNIADSIIMIIMKDNQNHHVYCFVIDWSLPEVLWRLGQGRRSRHCSSFLGWTSLSSWWWRWWRWGSWRWWWWVWWWKNRTHKLRRINIVKGGLWRGDTNWNCTNLSFIFLNLCTPLIIFLFLWLTVSPQEHMDLVISNTSVPQGNLSTMGHTIIGHNYNI